MIERISVLLLGANEEHERLLRGVLAHSAEVQSEPRLSAAVSATVRTQAHLVLVDLSTDPERGLRALRELQAELPDSRRVALATNKDPDLILEAMRSGAREFALLEATTLGAVLESLLRQSPIARSAGTLISVFPVKGGIGATTTAVNLGGSLVAMGHSVLLVDLRPHLGDALVFLDLAQGYSIGDVLRNRQRLDRELLRASLARHASGLCVLAQAESFDGEEQPATADIGDLLKFLTQQFDYVICDGLRGFDETSLAALDAARRVLLLLTQDVPSMRNAQRCLKIFERLGYTEEKVQLVVGRYHKRATIDLAAISENLGWPVSAVVSNDYSAVKRAIERGLLLGEVAPRAGITGDIQQLAGQLAGAMQHSERGLLRALFRRHAVKQSEPTSSARPGLKETEHDAGRSTATSQ